MCKTILSLFFCWSEFLSRGMQGRRNLAQVFQDFVTLLGDHVVSPFVLLQDESAFRQVLEVEEKVFSPQALFRYTSRKVVL